MSEDPFEKIDYTHNYVFDLWGDCIGIYRYCSSTELSWESIT